MSLRSTLAAQVKASPLGLPLKRIIERVRDLPRARRVRRLVKVARWESPACAVCGGRRLALHHRYNGFRIVRCLDDGLLFVSPRPADMAPFYDGRYYTDPVLGYRDYGAHAAEYDAEWQSRLDEIETATGKRGTLLDVGCATGEFLWRARTRGFEVTGIELSAWGVEQARKAHGLEVLQGSLPDARLASASRSVVTFFDCIEHVARPAEVLTDVLRVLEPGGLLVLSTGAVPHLDPRLESHWYYPPWHLYYFSHETMTKLLERTGFTAIDYREQEGLMIVTARKPRPPAEPDRA